MEWIGRSMRWETPRGRGGLEPGRLLERARALLSSSVCRHLLLVFAIAGGIVLLDQGARPLADAILSRGARVPLLGGGLVLEEVPDAASAATLQALRLHLAVGLIALIAMAALTRFMGWYGIALLGAFGLILGGAESNHLSLVSYGYVLNWIGYRIDGPTVVLAPADLVQMAGLAIIASSLTLFTTATLAAVVPTGRPRPPTVGAARGSTRAWDRTSMIAAR